MANKPRGTVHKRRYTDEQLSIVRDFLLRYYFGSIKARDCARRHHEIDPSLGKDNEVAYWQHAIKVIDWMLRGAGWRPGMEAELGDDHDG